MRVTDGYCSSPPRRSWFRLDDSTTSILTIIGLILALPLVGAYSCWQRRARNGAKIEDQQALPLVGLGGGVAAVSNDDAASHPQLARTEISSQVRGTADVRLVY